MRITAFLGDVYCLQSRNDGYILHIEQDQKRIGSINYYILFHFVKFLYISLVRRKNQGKNSLNPR